MPEWATLRLPHRLIVAGAGTALVTISALTWWRCPFHALTGWYCPGCGSTRAVEAAFRGDVEQALHNNALLPLAGAAMLIGLLPQGSRLETALRQRRTTIVTLAMALMVLYTVARNSFAPWLAPVA